MRPVAESTLMKDRTPLKLLYSSIDTSRCGIGTLKRPYLGYSRSETELALMRRIKAALDPHGILNPGKVI